MQFYHGFRAIPLLVAVSTAAAQPVDTARVVDAPPAVVAVDTSGIRIAWLEYQETDPAAYQAVGEYLAGALGFPVSHEVFRDYEYEDIARRMDARLPATERIDVAVLTPFGYISVKRLKRGVNAFASYLRAGSATYRARIVWKSSSGLRTADDVVRVLRDSPQVAIAIVNEKSTSGFQIPFAWLLSRHKLDLRRDVRSITAGSHSAALDSLIRGGHVLAATVWDGALDQFASDHPKLTKQLRSQPIGIDVRHDAAAMRSGVAPARSAAVRQAFLDMDNSPSGRDALKLFRRRMSGWTSAKNEDYDNLRAFTQAEFDGLRVRVADVTASKARDTLALREAIQQQLRDGWFEPWMSEQEPDVSIAVHVDTSAHRRIAHVREVERSVAQGARATSVAGASMDELAMLIVLWLKERYPLQAYLAEYGVNTTRGHLISVGTDRAVGRGAPVSISRLDAIRDVVGRAHVTDVINARVKEITRDGAWIELLDPSDSTRITLDPSDGVSYLATISPTEIGGLPDTLELSLGQPTIARDGSVWLPITVQLLRRNGTAMPAGPAGFEIQLEARTPFKAVSAARRVALIPPTVSFIQDSLLLTGTSLGSVVRVRTPHASRLQLDVNIGMLILWSLIVWAILGGAVGGIVSEWGINLPAIVADWRKDIKGFLARTALAACVGVVSGLMMYLIVVLVPEVLNKGEIVSHAASGFAGQFLVGLLGGFIGAHGIAAFIKKWLGLGVDHPAPARASTSI